ncbi:MAG: FBP domain-containing protein [Nocardioidaceae bacterium]
MLIGYAVPEPDRTHAVRLLGSVIRGFVDLTWSWSATAGRSACCCGGQPAPGPRAARCARSASRRTRAARSPSSSRKTGAAGKKGDSTGIYICRDLVCSLYVRGKLVSGAASLPETLTLEASIGRLRRNLDQLVSRVLVA